MRKYLLGLYLIVIGLMEVKSQWVTIPDTAFALFLKQQFPSCINGLLIDTTCSGIITTTNLNCSLMQITSLEGIQYFDALTTLVCYLNRINNLPHIPVTVKYLDCGGNKLTNLPTLPPLLNYLDCYGNQLTSLPNLPPSISTLKCSYNRLTNLPNLHSSLSYLSCNNNQLTNLPQLPASLTGLYCSNNQLTNLPIIPSSLIRLQCDRNQLTSIPSLPASLTLLTCNNNQLTNLPNLPDRITDLACSDNQLTSLPSLPSSLTYLYCNNNQLTVLPSLPDSLNYLYCNNNKLSNLPNFPPLFYGLDCSFNKLTVLPPLPSNLYQFQINDNPLLLCMPPLKKFSDQASKFNISKTGIKCLPNFIIHNGYIPAIDTMPICDLFNINGCEVGWNIHGTIYKDDNSDCVQQSNELNPYLVKMNLYESNILVQSGYFPGNFSFDTDLSICTVSIDTTDFPFEPTCPTSGDTTLSLTAQDSLRYGIDFGLKCKPGFDIGAKSILGNLFRPAWDTKINIGAGDMANAFGVHCAAGVSGSVSVSFTGPAKYIFPAPGALTPNNVNGNTLTYTIADFGSTNFNKDFNIIIRPDTTAQAGEQICFTVSVTPTARDNNPGNNVLTQCFTVRTSYDPNDKQVYPDGDILPEQEWLTYTIRFQNTGNDTAIHVQIIDTLDSDIDMASFKLLAYSHPNITQILEGGIVKFNFPNIMLPDSHVNEPLSHGYIQYKVKLKENLPIGTKIENTAYIYFDFNAPVVTNTTTNTISTVTAVASLSFGDGLEVKLFPNPAKDQVRFYITDTKDHVQMNLYNPIGELVRSLTINNSYDMDVSGFANGVYQVCIITPNGKLSSKRLVVAR